MMNRMIHNHTILLFMRRREYALVFLVCVGLLALLQWYPSFPDPDSFYHARIAAQMINGPVHSFTALPFTVLSDIFIDHHFLYHILLIPFVIVFDPLIGLKVATVLFAAAFLTFFYRILRVEVGASMGVALLFLTFLALNSIFIFRINLAKIPAISLLVFFLGLIAIMKRRHAHLFGLSFLYVWLYGGWPLLPFSSLIAWGIYAIAAMTERRSDNFLSGLRSERAWFFSWLIYRPREKSERAQRQSLAGGLPAARRIIASLKTPIASFSGAIAGIIINPYFPANIFFTWIQTFKIALLNVLTDIPVGGEWYPPGVSFIPAHGTTLMLLVFALCAFCFPGLFALVFRTQEPRREWRQWFLCALTLLFFALTLKSRRYGEYFAPLATLFSAFVLSPLLHKEQYTHLLQTIRKNIIRPRSARGIITLYFLVVAPLIVGANMFNVTESFRGGYSFSRYTDGMTWIQKHVPEHLLIFHNRWDDFPVFYYRAPTYQYISGLDSRFFFEKNPEQAKEYTTFSTGADFTRTFGYRGLCATALATREHTSIPELPASLIKCTPLAEKQKSAEVVASFSPAAVVITHLDLPLDEKIRGVRGFAEVYRDSDMVILQSQE